MSDENYRLVAKSLRRLAALESLALAGSEEMYDLVRGVCNRINRDTGADLPILELNPPQFVSGYWSITFRGRGILAFDIRTGASPAVPDAVAKCTVGPYYEIQPLNRAPDLAMFHYVKLNDHGVWRQVSRDLGEAVKVSDSMILDLIMIITAEHLKLYPRS